MEADFKALVDTLFPHGALPPLEKERLLQRVFLKRMIRVYVLNPEYDAHIDRFVKSADGRSIFGIKITEICSEVT